MREPMTRNDLQRINAAFASLGPSVPTSGRKIEGLDTDEPVPGERLSFWAWFRMLWARVF